VLITGGRLRTTGHSVEFVLASWLTGGGHRVLAETPAVSDRSPAQGSAWKNQHPVVIWRHGYPRLPAACRISRAVGFCLSLCGCVRITE
jgi:hypothetical protein